MLVKITVVDKTSKQPLSDSEVTLHTSLSDRLVLTMRSLDKFNNAAGPITVVYSGGSIVGEGGPVEVFSETFIPTGLIAKPNQNAQEHISITSVIATGGLKKIVFTDTTTGAEHISIAGVAVTGKLTHINDI